MGLGWAKTLAEICGMRWVRVDYKKLEKGNGLYREECGERVGRRS